MFRLIRFLIDSLITLFTRDAGSAYPDNRSFPWIPGIEANWAVIRQEFDRMMLDPERIPNVEDISQDGNLGADRRPMSKGPEWKWFFLHGYNHKIEENCAHCPETTHLVESIPDMCGAIFAVLAPGKHIPPHRGLYKGLLRFHLGVRVSQPGLCGIKVKGETRHWEEGRGFVFDDTWTHEAWNDSTEPRVVLMIDVERPLNPVLTRLNRFILRWISSTSYITDAIGKARMPAAKVSQPARQQEREV